MPRALPLVVPVLLAAAGCARQEPPLAELPPSAALGPSGVGDRGQGFQQGQALHEQDLRIGGDTEARRYPTSRLTPTSSWKQPWEVMNSSAIDLDDQAARRR